jgi:hypothetical protein
VQVRRETRSANAVGKVALGPLVGGYDPWFHQQRSVETVDAQPIAAQRALDVLVAHDAGGFVEAVPEHRFGTGFRDQLTQRFQRRTAAQNQV